MCAVPRAVPRAPGGATDRPCGRLAPLGSATGSPGSGNGFAGWVGGSLGSCGMRPLPVADPGAPDHRSPARFLLWVARSQWSTLALAALWGSVWMAAQALTPAVVGRAVDAGLTRGSTGALLGWCGLLLALGAVQALGGVLRHRMAIFNRYAATYRTVQVLGQHAARVGAALTERIAAGEVVAVGTSDVTAIGSQMDVIGRAAGAV